MGGYVSQKVLWVLVTEHPEPCHMLWVRPGSGLMDAPGLGSSADGSVCRFLPSMSGMFFPLCFGCPHWVPKKYPH